LVGICRAGKTAPQSSKQRFGSKHFVINTSGFFTISEVFSRKQLILIRKGANGGLAVNYLPKAFFDV